VELRNKVLAKMQREDPEKYAELDLSDPSGIDADIKKMLQKFSNPEPETERETFASGFGSSTLSYMPATPSTNNRAVRTKKSKKQDLVQKLGM